MGIWWHVCVTEQVVKSFSQIKRVNNLQSIIWRKVVSIIAFSFIWLEHAQLYENEQEETNNTMVETTHNTKPS